MSNYQSRHTGAEIDDGIDAVATKQDKLISAVNIKTINNQSMLGSGNISINTEGATNPPLQGKKISFLGDSISNPSQSYTWITRAITALGLEKLVQDGSVASTVCRGGYNSVIENDRHLKLHTEVDGVITDPDIIVFFMGTNDWANEIPLGAYTGHGAIPTRDTGSIFSNTYALILYEMSTRYPMARIWCGTLLPRKTIQDTPYPQENGLGVTILDYNNVIRQIATAMNCQVLDFASCGITDANIYTFLDDGTHPHWDYNGIGHLPMAEKMIGQMTANCNPTVNIPAMASKNQAGIVNMWYEGDKLYFSNGAQTFEVALLNTPVEPPVEPPVDPPVDPPAREYTELEYIEFSGIRQYFDTDIPYATDTDVVVESYLVDAKGAAGLVGFKESVSPLSLRWVQGLGGIVHLGANPYKDAIPNVDPLTLAPISYSYSGDNTSLTATASVGGNTVSVTSAVSSVPSNNLAIGMTRLDMYGVVSRGYRFKAIYDPTKIKVNIVACKMSDGRVGIYDKVKDVFIEVSYPSGYTGAQYAPLTPENTLLTKKCYDNDIIPLSTNAEQRQQLVDAGIDPDV